MGDGLIDRRTGIFLGLLFIVVVLVPAGNLLAEPGSGLHVPSHIVALLGKYLCYALLAVALDLCWGYAGILSLGHGAFFALGGYAMGMHLMREIGDRGVYANPELPDFMVFLSYDEAAVVLARLRHVLVRLPDGAVRARARWRSSSGGLRSASGSPASISRSSPRR